MTGARTAPPGFDEAYARFAARDYVAARDLLRACVTQAPWHLGSLIGLAVCERELGALPEAERLLRHALGIDGSHVQAHFMLAKVLAEQGRKGEAIAELQAALQLDPHHAGAHQDLARLQGVEAQLAAGSGLIPTPASKGTLAERVDDPAVLLDALTPGAVLAQGHRALLSHRRLWLGLPIAGLGLLTLHWANQIEEAAPAKKVTVLVGPGGRTQSINDAEGTLVRILADITRYTGWALVVVGLLGLFSAFVNSGLSRYVIRERRIDITEGVFRRIRRTVWLYRIQDVRLVQNLAMMAGGTARLTIHQEESQVNPTTRMGWWLRQAPSITGIASTRHMITLMEDLQRRAILERRAMKKAFI